MFARIKHVAIVTNNHPRLGRFYESVLGMKMQKSDINRVPRKGGTDAPKSAVSVTDGNIGMTLIGREAGYPAGLDHFGIDVDDIELVEKRVREHYPSVSVLKRPSYRGFASFSAHDPAGNVFDLTSQGMENLRGIYAQTGWEQRRYIQPGFSCPCCCALFNLEPEAAQEAYEAMTVSLTDSGTFDLMDSRNYLEEIKNEMGIKKNLVVEELLDFRLLREVITEARK